MCGPEDAVVTGVCWISVDTPLPSGPVHVAVTEQGVLATTYWKQPVPGVPGPAEAPGSAGGARTAAVRDALGAYFGGRSRRFGLPIDWRLTAGAQRAVLRTLHRTVPYGETVTYGELAARSGVFDDGDAARRALAARTVGSIMGSNPLPLLVPCHRVVAADGLGGFGGLRGDLEIKRWLLTLEGCLAPTLDWNGPA